MENKMDVVPIKQNTYSITLIGEILVDEICNEAIDQTDIVYGGSPANIASNMSDLGMKDIQFFGAIGEDYYGRSLLRNFQDRGIQTSHIAITDAKTSVVKINKTDATPIPIFKRGADMKIELTDDLEQSIINSSIMHFSYWPLSSEPSKTTILQAIEIAKEAGTLIGFDPNYHPDLMGDEGLTPKELINILAFVDIVKPSLDDSKRIFGDQLTIEQYFKMYTDLGIKLVVMTLGKDGVLAKYNNRFYHQPSLATEVVDATGAGDAFISGLYAGILTGEPIEQLLQLGSGCSAENLKQVGAISDLPQLAELKRKYKIGE